MPWKECHVMDERLRFVSRLLEGEKSRRSLRSASGDSRQSRHDCEKSRTNVRVNLLFGLQQEVTTYDAYLQRIEECDHALEHHLRSLADKGGDNGDAPP